MHDKEIRITIKKYNHCTRLLVQLLYERQCKFILSDSFLVGIFFSSEASPTIWPCYANAIIIIHFLRNESLYTVYENRQICICMNKYRAGFATSFFIGFESVAVQAIRCKQRYEYIKFNFVDLSMKLIAFVSTDKTRDHRGQSGRRACPQLMSQMKPDRQFPSKAPWVVRLNHRGLIAGNSSFYNFLRGSKSPVSSQNRSRSSAVQPP